MKAMIKSVPVASARRPCAAGSKGSTVRIRCPWKTVTGRKVSSSHIIVRAAAGKLLQSIALIKNACRCILAAVVTTLSCWLSLVKAVLLLLETMPYVYTVSPLEGKLALIVTSAHCG